MVSFSRKYGQISVFCFEIFRTSAAGPLVLTGI
eukprot:COSAG01_NODE_61794_length_287_cov_8.409574_1_plen_32_part_10